MNAMRDESGGREKRVREVESWRAVDIFSPQPLTRPDARFPVTDVGQGEPMPWEPGSRHYASPPPGREWRHEVFGGAYELSRVRDTLAGLYGPEADGNQAEPAGGQLVLFACTVDAAGVLVPGTAVLSSCAWAVGRALAAPGALSPADFAEDACQFGADLARLAGADGDAASALLAGSPLVPAPAPKPDLRLRPLRREDLRLFAARLSERLGVTEALRPCGLLVRGYQVDAERADEQAAPSFLDGFYADDLACCLAVEQLEAALALTRLAGLRQDAADVYAAITVVEDTLRTLAGQRVAAERSLRAVCHRRGAAGKALEAHARAKPGLRAQLSTRFGAGREWRARQAGLEAALGDRAAPVDAAQRELAQVQAQFAAVVRARAEAAATLRRLTAECAEAQEGIARARQRWGEHHRCLLV
jgi:hypothetical protein